MLSTREKTLSAAAEVQVIEKMIRAPVHQFPTDKVKRGRESRRRILAIYLYRLLLYKAASEGKKA